jgi:diguanylate cyclase (GGDEF)-like protein
MMKSFMPPRKRIIHENGAHLQRWKHLMTNDKEKSSRQNQTLSVQVGKRMDNQAMIFDLFTGLTRMRTEEDVIQRILDLFAMLFEPGQMTYASVVNGRVASVWGQPTPAPEPGLCQTWLDEGRAENTWMEAEHGFYIRLSYQDQTLGLLDVKGVAFPQFELEYLSMALNVLKLCGLAIANVRLSQEVQLLENADPLTGLNNRRHFFSLADIEFARARRYARPLACILLDIDQFKKVNETYGHAVGDQVLHEVAKCCLQELRQTDICGRYGGDEFIFLLPESSQENAWHAAERIRKKIRELPIVVEEKRLEVTVCLGAAGLEVECQSLEVLFDHCDQVLHAAKESGPNRVRVWKINVHQADPFGDN